jgi:hypothetical protein
MPSYTFPPVDRTKPDEKPDIVASSAPDEWERTITIPVNDDILDSVAIEDEISINLVATVSEMAKRDSEDHSSKSLTVVISSVEVYEESDMAEEDFNAGFSSGYSERA